MTELSDKGGSSDESPTVENTGVVTTSDIPALSVTGPYPGQLDFARNVTDDVNVKHVIEVKYKNGRISMESDFSNQWLQYIQAARDRHEQNVEFFRADDKSIYLQTIRKVTMGEHLYAWFSDSLAREMDIPFLTLQNIRGNQNYVCGQCNTCYKYPNPLKSHMKFTCEYSSRIDDNQVPSPNRPIFRPFQDESKPTTTRGQLEGNYSSLCYRQSVRHLSAFHRPGTSGIPAVGLTSFNIFGKHGSTPEQRSANVPSFFNQTSLPFITSQISQFKMNNFCTFMSPYMYSSGKLGSLDCRTTHFQTPLGSQSDSVRGTVGSRISFPQPSEVEGEPLDMLPKSFFANKSKKGHLCIYCGKLYSRKYGLKIHLRTHTGYKPLKCKVCMRPFGDPSNLNKHVRLHSEGETPYRCEFCGKVLVRRRDLERHLKSRHAGVDNKNAENIKANSAEKVLKEDAVSEIVVT